MKLDVHNVRRAEVTGMINHRIDREQKLEKWTKQKKYEMRAEVPSGKMHF
jgi:hypothetical protein